MKKFLQATVAVIFLCEASQAKQITLAVGAVIFTDEIAIGSNEFAEVKSIYGPGGGSGCTIYFIKNGVTNSSPTSLFIGGGSTIPNRLPTIAGPATIRLTGSGTAFCTVKIEPESFPPDKTIIIPQGTPGANIIMEQSSDLITWTNSVPGIYTNTAISHLFFRLRAERL